MELAIKVASESASDSDNSLETLSSSSSSETGAELIIGGRSGTGEPAPTFHKKFYSKLKSIY